MKKSRAILSALVLSFVAGNALAHSAPLDKSAMAACKEKTRSQSCEYQDHHNNLYIGTCQYVSEQDLICVRNRPVQKTDSGAVQSDTGHPDHQKTAL
jgi:hypothetical protein